MTFAEDSRYLKDMYVPNGLSFSSDWESRCNGGRLSSQLFKISGVQHFVPWTWKLPPPGDFGLLAWQTVPLKLMAVVDTQMQQSL